MAFYATLSLLSLLVICRAQSPPIQVHLALTGNSGSLIVSWFTVNQTETSVVLYGTSSGSYTQKAVGTSSTYSSAVGWVHDAILAGLSRATVYYYVVGDPNAGLSDEFTFTTSRNDDETQPELVGATIPMYGDMGATNSNATAQRLHAWLDRADFFFHVGDISYADDVESKDFERTWDAWFELMAPVLPYAPYMVCPGNHEHQSATPVISYSKDFNVYNHRFRMPSVENNSTTNSSMWYSFDYGGVHFVSISTETDYAGSEFTTDFGDQGDWLKRDLAAAHANRANVPWIVAVGHRPLYSSDVSPYVKLFMPALKHFVEDLFHEYQVDLYVCGHVHSYERSYPVYKDKVVSTDYTNPQALVQLVAGGAGCPEGAAPLAPGSPWSAHRYSAGWGYGVLNVTDAKSLTWSYYRSADDGLEDQFTITRTSAPN
eukprot:TRINITY_DN8280_c0_g1_i2.p1 TRINITY_DN8280_c0_g1~~TRINITY_DN8280_c0_g1_i2.p1  ORF type:complete len:430 (+),score=114.27 TRINITY_DN8280_c0_g1_i2:166-1455(+)